MTNAVDFKAKYTLRTLRLMGCELVIYYGKWTMLLHQPRSGSQGVVIMFGRKKKKWKVCGVGSVEHSDENIRRHFQAKGLA